MTSTAVIKGQPIGPRWLPDFVAEHISERLELTQAVDELEALAGQCDAVMQRLTKAAPTVAGQMELAAGQDAIRMLGH